MGYLVQTLELQDDVAITAIEVIAKMQVRAKSGDTILLIYSGLINVEHTVTRGLLGLTETENGNSTNCQMSSNDISDFHSLAGGMVVVASGDFEVRLDAGSVV